MKKLGAFIFTAITSAAALAGPTMWIGDSSGKLGTIDIDTGNVQVIGSMGQVMTDIAFDPSGNLYGITFSSLYKIDKNTAATTFVGNFGASLNSLVFDATGTLFAANSSLYTIDTGTGQASAIGNGGSSYSSSGDLAFINGNLFLSNGIGNALTQINTSTGAGTNIGNMGYANVYGLASNDNVHLYGMTGTNIISIDMTTGAGSNVLNYGGKGLGIAWGAAFVREAAPVPEPETYALLLAGLALVGTVVKRKNTAA